MKIYLQDLINRLAQFSEKLDNTSLFIDKPWVLIDANSNRHKYIFQRNGSLLMSLNGQVKMGKWEYLAVAKSILIDRITDKILLNQYFVNGAIMILKIDGANNQQLILANENAIPDLDIEKYMVSLYDKKFNIVRGELESGKMLEVYLDNANSRIEIGLKVKINGNIPEDGKYRSLESKKNYEVKNGKIIQIYHSMYYRTIDDQNLVIEQVNKNYYMINDLVYKDGYFAQDGKYTLSPFKVITVKYGMITGKSLF